MQYVAIKKEEKDGKIVFVVNAIPLKNKNKSIVQKIPHPLGSDVLEYKTLEEAREAISRAGFSCILPDGKHETSVRKVKSPASKIPDSYDNMVYMAIKSKINSQNSNVSASAILAISEFPTDETFDILFEKIGEDNDLIRKNAISGICRYGKFLQNKIIEALNSQNWITRNSAISCILNLASDVNTDIEKFISPLVSATDDSNPIVQANALSALAVVFQSYKKNKQA